MTDGPYKKDHLKLRSWIDSSGRKRWTKKWEGWQRAAGINPKAKGTSKRQLGTNPRALGTNPRAKP